MKNTLVKTEIKKDTKKVSKLELLKTAVEEARSNYEKLSQKLSDASNPYLRAEFNTMTNTLTTCGFGRIKSDYKYHALYSNGTYLVKMFIGKPSATVYMLDEITNVKDILSSGNYIATFGNSCCTVSKQQARDAAKAFCAFIYAITD